MKIQVTVEVPDVPDCNRCAKNGDGHWCEIFGGRHKTPCPACIEARKAVEEGK